MTDEGPEVQPAAPDAKAPLSRRGLLRGAGGIGIAGVAASMLVDTAAGVASAATAHNASASHTQAPASDPLVAHVHDARTGEVDLFTGEQHVRVHNPALAHALARAAATSH
jgi:hypothetical protein